MAENYKHLYEQTKKMLTMYQDELIPGFRKKIEELEAKVATDNNVGSKWISVKDQEEPTENGTYLCHGYWFGSKRKQTETAEFFGEWNIANNFILTHWMEIPEPPKEVDND